MQPKNSLRSNRTLGIILICGLLLVVGLGIWWFRPPTAPNPFPEPPVPAPEAPPVQTAPVESQALPRPRPVIRYQDDDEAVQELMRRRKKEYGLNESVDMIVKPDETMRIGDAVIPMKEILDKIRIQGGGVVEEDLSPEAVAARRQALMDRLYRKLTESEKRFWELEAELRDPEAIPDADVLRVKMEEHAELGRIVTDFQAYKEALKEIDARETLLNDLGEADDPKHVIRQRLETLRETAAGLEAELRKGMEGFDPAVSDETGDAEGLMKTLVQAENRYWELEKALQNPASEGSSEEASSEKMEEMTRERAELRERVAVFQEYKRVREKIREYEALLEKDKAGMTAAIQEDLNALRIERNDLEDRLLSRLLPAEDFEIYGVHVVRPGDNIWNIHFRFLKEYFNNREIRLSPVSDERDYKGLSSGVGKILKFSEKMVHIYNLRERRLESDLNMIHPLSKIVVFNMGQAFDLLNQIDYQNITEIRFDGENLWVPAG